MKNDLLSQFDAYQNDAMRTANDLSAEEKILNGAMGMCGESGEVMDHMKKFMFQKHPLDYEKVAEEAGDVLWYIACLADGLGISLAEIAQRNIAKLQKRYPAGFNPERSLNRKD